MLRGKCFIIGLVTLHLVVLLAVSALAGSGYGNQAGQGHDQTDGQSIVLVDKDRLAELDQNRHRRGRHLYHRGHYLRGLPLSDFLCL